MFRFVNRQCFGEGRDGAFSCDVGRSIELAHRPHQARKVDDVALSLAQVRQGKLTRSKDADKVQIQEIAEILGAELVNRFVRWMPTGVVDEAVESTVLG